MDHNLATKDWAKRFDLRVLRIVCIDTYLFTNKSSMQTKGQQASSSSMEDLWTSSSTIKGDSFGTCSGRTRHGGSRNHCRSNANNQVNYLLQATQQGETSRAGEVRLQGMQEAIHLRLQRVHAHHRSRPEAVLVLQSHVGLPSLVVGVHWSF